MHVSELKYGRDQPFYHVLPDTRDRPGAQLTYVAQADDTRSAQTGDTLVTSLEARHAAGESVCRGRESSRGVPRVRALARSHSAPHEPPRTSAGPLEGGPSEGGRFEGVGRSGREAQRASQTGREAQRASQTGREAQEQLLQP